VIEQRLKRSTDAVDPTPKSLVPAVGLAALALAGHAAALQLIDVKPYAAFQHYRTWQWMLAERPWAAALLLAQSAVVLALAWRYRRTLPAAFGGRLSILRALLVLALAGFSLAVPTESISRFFGEAVLAGVIAIVALLNLVLFGLALPDSHLAHAAAWVDARITVGQRPSAMRRWDRRLPVTMAVWVAVAAAVVSYVVLEHLPHIDDSVSNLFQAKYFAAGRLYLPAPPDTESFSIDLTVVKDGKWFGYAFPGWPAVLSIGVLAGVPWLVNPVLAGFQILLAHAWLLGRCGRGTANLVVLLLAASSWLIFTSAELMGHPLTALLVLLALVAFDRAADERSRWALWALLAGGAAGMLMLTRSFDGIILAGALGLMTLIDGRLFRARRPILIAGLAAAALAALIFPYNQAVTGSATLPAHQAWADIRYGPGVDVLGFGPNVGVSTWPNLDPLPGHGPADVVLNLNKNLFMVNIDLFGWAMGSLLFVYLAFGLGRWRREDACLHVLVASYLIGYSAFYFSGGPDLGARYWYPILVPLAALSARGVQLATADLHARGALTHAGARVGAFIGAATLSAAVVMVPWRAATKHYRYRGITGEARELAASHHFEHGLVFVRAPENGRDYQSAFILNPPTLDDPATIYAFDAGPERRAALVARFPDRPVWVIGRGSEHLDAGPPLRVLAGPLAPGTVPD
jgi:4-amino-4-deoxy-L-arabinose transferase-like glycosyltransferase